MKSFFEKYGTALQLLGLALFAFGMFGIGVKVGAKATAQAYDLRIVTMERDQARDVGKAQAATIQAKDKAATDIAAADSQHRKDLTDAKATADRTLADFRADTLRLRERFTCASAFAVRADDAATSAGGTDGAGPGAGGGLSAADAEFLVRESARADAALAKVKALRAVVRADRGQ